jgi:hypothetical protein
LRKCSLDVVHHKHFPPMVVRHCLLVLVKCRSLLSLGRCMTSGPIGRRSTAGRVFGRLRPEFLGPGRSRPVLNFFVTDAADCGPFHSGVGPSRLTAKVVCTSLTAAAGVRPVQRKLLTVINCHR